MWNSLLPEIGLTLFLPAFKLHLKDPIFLTLQFYTSVTPFISLALLPIYTSSSEKRLKPLHFPTKGVIAASVAPTCITFPPILLNGIWIYSVVRAFAGVEELHKNVQSMYKLYYQ